MKRRNVLGYAICAAALTVSMTACNGDDKDKASAKEPTKTSSSTPKPAPSPSNNRATAIPTKVANQVKARSDVRVSGCEGHGKDGAEAKGTVSNKGKKDATYKITIFFTTKSATVVDFASTKVQVPAGEDKTWTVSREFDSPKDVQCVLRGVAKS